MQRKMDAAPARTLPDLLRAVAQGRVARRAPDILRVRGFALPAASGAPRAMPQPVDTSALAWDRAAQLLRNAASRVARA